MPRLPTFLFWGFVVLLLPRPVSGQGIAALKQQITQSKEDTSKVNKLAVLSKKYWYVDADSAMTYGKEALALAEQLNYTDGKAQAYSSIAVIYDNRSDYAQSEKYYRLSLQLFESVGNYRRAIKVMNNLGASFYGQSRYQEALEWYDRLIAVAKEHHLDDQVALTYNNMGLVYEVKGDLVKALDLYMLGAKVAERNNDIGNASFSYLNAGYIYASIDNNEHATMLFDKAIEYYTKLEDKYSVATTKMYIIELNIIKNPDSAHQLPILREALALYLRAQDNASLTICYDNIGQVYRIANDTIRARYYFEKSLVIAKNQQNAEYIAKSLYHMAQVANTVGNYPRAVRLADEGYAVARKGGNLPVAKDILQLLVEIYQNKKDVNKIIEYNKKLKDASDELFKIEKEKLFESIENNYSSYKTILENDELKQKEAQQLATIREQETVRVSLILGLIIIAAIATILFLNNRSKQQANLRLEAQKQELKDLNAVKDKILSIIAHDLRGPLNSIEGLMTVLEAGMLAKHEEQALIHRIRTTNANTLETLDTLLRWARAQKGSEAVDLRPVDMYRMVEKKNDFFAEDLRRKHQVLRNGVQPGNAVMADETQLDFVIRNLVANAIKFTPNGGEITVETRPVGTDMVAVVVKDTGVGMQPDQIDGLFHPTTHTSTRGTAGEKGSGLGLLLSKEFVENNGGKIDVISDPGTGTEFIVTLRRA